MKREIEDRRCLKFIVAGGHVKMGPAVEAGK
jgi:hypothetical protein